MGNHGSKPVLGGNGVDVAKASDDAIAFVEEHMFSAAFLDTLYVANAGARAGAGASAAADNHEYFLSPERLLELQMSVYAASHAPAAGILEPGGKTATVAHLAESLASAMPVVPTFTSVHAKRMDVMWYLWAVLVGDVQLDNGPKNEGLSAGDRVVRGPDWRYVPRHRGSTHYGCVHAARAGC